MGTMIKQERKRRYVHPLLCVRAPGKGVRGLDSDTFSTTTPYPLIPQKSQSGAGW